MLNSFVSMVVIILGDMDTVKGIPQNRIGIMGKKDKKERPEKCGRKPEVLKIEGDWQDAVNKALTKKPPKKSK